MKAIRGRSLNARLTIIFRARLALVLAALGIMVGLAMERHLKGTGPRHPDGGIAHLSRRTYAALADARIARQLRLCQASVFECRSPGVRSVAGCQGPPVLGALCCVAPSDNLALQKNQSRTNGTPHERNRSETILPGAGSPFPAFSGRPGRDIVARSRLATYDEQQRPSWKPATRAAVGVLISGHAEISVTDNTGTGRSSPSSGPAMCLWRHVAAHRRTPRRRRHRRQPLLRPVDPAGGVQRRHPDQSKAVGYLSRLLAERTRP